MTAEEVEAACGCPNLRCYAAGFDPCVDRNGDPIDYPHAARVRVAASIERDVREFGGLPEHDPALARRRR